MTVFFRFACALFKVLYVVDELISCNDSTSLCKSFSLQICLCSQQVLGYEVCSGFQYFYCLCNVAIIPFFNHFHLQSHLWSNKCSTCRQTMVKCSHGLKYAIYGCVCIYLTLESLSVASHTRSICFNGVFISTSCRESQSGQQCLRGEKTSLDGYSSPFLAMLIDQSIVTVMVVDLCVCVIPVSDKSPF